MIKLKVIALSKSGKSALCVAILEDSGFESELGIGNIRINKPMTVGAEYQTGFTHCKVITTMGEATEEYDAREWNKLVLSK